MRIARTGASGFLGRHIADRLAGAGHQLRCGFRAGSDRDGFADAAASIEWVNFDLADPAGFVPFCKGADAVIHGALFRPRGKGFRAAAGDAFEEFVHKNLLGSISLLAAARCSDVPRFVFISSCAVHEVILPDRALDEAHPLWPRTHYGAHKAAIEKFIHSYGLGDGWAVCALRPTGIYGLAHPPSQSRWFDIVRRVVAGEPFGSDAGGKEVHAADVARATEILLAAPAEKITGQAFNCYDLYVAEQHVAELAREISGSAADVSGANKGPRHQIDTTRIRSLGMQFGGEPVLRQTIARLVDAAR
jgi:nucleoside-diphosphate-sugar epimerase